MSRKCVIKGKYRYSLEILNDTDVNGQRILIVLINPSTADENNDDPTTRNIKKWCKEKGYCSATIVNLFAYITPSKVRIAKMKYEDAVGKENDKYILKCSKNADTCFVA